MSVVNPGGAEEARRDLSALITLLESTPRSLSIVDLRPK
jgi:hypothetical protein